MIQAHVLLISKALDLDPLPAIQPLGLILVNLPQFGASQIITLIISLFALLLSGFISGSEIAYFSLSPAQIEDLDDDNPRSRTILRLLENPQRLLATILISNNLVNVTIVVLTNFALGPIFQNMGAVLSFILQSVIITFLILLFGEILPKIYCSNFPMEWARFAAPGLRFLSTLCRPLSGMLVRSTTIVNRVVTKETHNISTDDLSQALDITDVKTKDDKEMLQGILRFGDTRASEIMTPRIDIVGIEAESSFADVLDTVIKTGYSRLPVYNDTQDNILGILYSRDLLPYIGKDLAPGFDWHTLLREPYYVPESRLIDDLLEDFRKLKIHMAVVVDEFGGTQGLVTMEDVLEEIVGDINDEYDEEDSMYTRLSDDTYNFDGRIPLTDFFRITGVNPADFGDAAEDAETLAGLLLEIRGDFPKEKEPMVHGRCRFLVLKVADHRIISVRVNIMPDGKKS